MKHSGAVSIAPFFLRITVGIVFVWAGLGKVMATFPVEGEKAARLANMGVFVDKNAKPATPTAPTKADTPNPGASRVSTMHFAALRNAAASGQPATAEEYPNSVEVMRVYSLALDLDEKANATDLKDAKGNPTFHLWPALLGKGIWPLAAAWSCTIAEIGCGTFLLVGLLVRFSSFVLCFNMLVAAWLTVIGPAIQSGETQLGFLPKYATFSMEWQMFLVQFLLIGATLALVFSGAGGLSLDRALFGGPTGSRPATAKDKEKDE